MAKQELDEKRKQPAAAETGSSEEVEAVMKKYDRESNVRIWTGKPKWRCP